jgi:tetrapyrrole methylase family protein/MazG family protein
LSSGPRIASIPIDIDTIIRALTAVGLEEPPGRVQIVFDPSAGIDASAPAILVSDASGSFEAFAASLRERYPTDHPIRLVGHDGHQLDTTVSTLASTVAPTERTAVYVPALSPEEDVRDFAGLVAIIRRLRDPESGCPWDREQTHESLKRYLLEETYEALAALDASDPSALREELGDLLLQIVLHARIAEQAGEFGTRDVIEGLNTKLLRRHPHVFGTVVAETADQVAQNWDDLKRAEKNGASHASALGGVPPAMPSLAYSEAILGRAERAGFKWPARDDILAKIAEEADELAAATDATSRREELGDLLFALVSLARWLDVDAEEALRMASAKFADRFRALERLTGERGGALSSTGDDELRSLWDEAKRVTARAGDADIVR